MGLATQPLLAYPEGVATRVFINGTITGPEDAKISVFDRGFLYGDSVYEVLRTSGGHLVDYQRHVQRLAKSAQGLALPTASEAEIHQAVRSTLESAQNEESYVRIVLTRGSGVVGLDMALAEKPTLLVIAKPLVLPTQEMYSQGVRVKLVNVQRTSAKAVDPSVKSGNYLNNILALAEAQKSGAYEAIMCDRDGWIAEGASSNLFFLHENTLHTPGLAVGLLAGITRRRVLELAQHLSIPVEEGHFQPEQLRGASEAFLTSSIRGILPIARVDDTVLGSDNEPVGPITQTLIASYGAFLRDEAKRTN